MTEHLYFEKGVEMQRGLSPFAFPCLQTFFANYANILQPSHLVLWAK